MRSRPLALAACALSALAAATPAAAADTARSVEVQILGINDLHGNLEPPAPIGGRPIGGVAYLAATSRRPGRTIPRGTIPVHAGDTVGASPLISSWFHDEPTIQATNLHAARRRHAGQPRVRRGRRRDAAAASRRPSHRRQADQERRGHLGPDFPGADYPYISANVVDAATASPSCRPTAIVEAQGGQGRLHRRHDARDAADRRARRGRAVQVPGHLRHRQPLRAGCSAGMSTRSSCWPTRAATRPAHARPPVRSSTRPRRWTRRWTRSSPATPTR